MIANNDLSRVIQLDLGKLPLKWIFAALVLILSLLSLGGESSHASELNKLPWNRTEITNIKNISMDLVNNNFIIKMFVDYIFPISMTQHYMFFHLDIVGSGYTVTMKTNETKSDVYHPVKNNTFVHDSPTFGNFTAKFMRSKTALLEKNYSDIKPRLDYKNTTFSCWEDSYKQRECEFYNFCFKPERLFWFSKHRISFSEPLLKLDKLTTISTKRAPKQLNQFMESQQIDEMVSGNNVIVSFSYYDPLSWRWISEVLAPLAEIVEKCKHIDKIYCIKAPREIIDSNLLSSIGPFSPVLPSDTICLQHATYKVLNNTRTMYSSLKNKIQKEFKDELRKHKLVVLISNETDHYFTNIKAAAQIIANTTQAHVIDVQKTDELEIIKNIFEAEFVVSTIGITSSQSFWLNHGTYVEFIPEGFECNTNCESPCIKGNVKYFRYVVTEKGIKPYQRDETTSCYQYQEKLPKSPLQIPLNNITSLTSN